MPLPVRDGVPDYANAWAALSRAFRNNVTLNPLGLANALMAVPGMAQGVAKQAYRGATLPGDVYAGRTDPNSDEAVTRSMDLAMTLPMAGVAAKPVEGGLGANIRAYHGTTRGEIGAFDPYHFSGGGGELGPHFGSKQQANYRVRGADKGAAVVPVNIEASKFLRMADRPSWDPLGGNFIEDLKESAGLNYDEIAPLYRMRDATEDVTTASQQYKKANKEARDYVRDLLTRKGYDSIGYQNKWEGRGDSIIPLKRGSVKNAITGETMFSNHATASLSAILSQALGEQ